MSSRGIKQWLINAISFYFQRFSNNNRDKNIWAFGAWEGNKYSDNSKYFYEYVKRNHKEIRCIWFTANKNVYNELVRRGDEVYLLGTKESKNMQLKAGVAFFTNGLDDFGQNPYIFGAYLVALWHGVSFKKIYGSDDIKIKNKYLKILRKIKNKIFDFASRDLSITTSNYMKTKVAEQFYICDLDTIVITGQPRNDILCKKNKLDLNGVRGKKIITYMPTYQSFNSQKELIELIDVLDNDIAFNNFLKNKGYVIVLKLHYLAKIEDLELNNIVLLNDNDVSDVQVLLAATDLLVTDYSSVFADFALTKRPIIFFRPNDETYLKVAGLYDEFSDVCSKNLALNKSQLVDYIIKFILKKQDYLEQDEIINEYFSDRNIKLGNYSMNVFDLVNQKITKKREYLP